MNDSTGDNRALVPSPDDTPSLPDSWDVYMSPDQPGGSAPHFEISPGRPPMTNAGRASTLFAFGDPDGDQCGAQAFAAAVHRKVPLRVVRCVGPTGMYAKKSALLRSCCHIAWHGGSIGDSMTIIDRARGTGT